MKPAPPHADSRFAFFQEFLKHPLQVGSIIPSSPFLEKRILEAASIQAAETVIELGTGTGGTTRAILTAMPEDARLLSIEINPNFHSIISSIDDDRLIAHLGSASDLKDIVSIYGLGAPDVIISGIPFSTMNRAEGTQVIEAISSILASNGRFVAYQASRRVANLCEPFLGPSQTMMELLNIPPLRLYRWEKKGG